MSANLRLVQGTGKPSSKGGLVEAGSPDRALFALIEEARILETRDRLFNRQMEQTIEESDDWLNGDREAALNSGAVHQMLAEHRPVIERLTLLPDLIAETPACSRDAVLEKLRFLATLLDGVEVDILESIIEDVEYLK